MNHERQTAAESSDDFPQNNATSQAKNQDTGTDSNRVSKDLTSTPSFHAASVSEHRPLSEVHPTSDIASHTDIVDESNGAHDQSTVTTDPLAHQQGKSRASCSS